MPGLSDNLQDAGTRTALQGLEWQYGILFGMNPDALFGCDGDGRLVDCNPALELLTGLDTRQLTGRPFVSLLVPDDAERARLHLGRALAGSAQSFEVSVRAEHGRDPVLAVTLVPATAAGIIQGVHGIARDVTRAHEAERALREVEDRYAVLAENVHDLISLHDADGAFLYASPSASTLLGYHPVELIGRSVYEIVEEGDVPVLQAAHAAIMRREGRQPATFRARRSDGSVRWLESTARVLWDEDQLKPWRIIAVTRDITDRRAMEQQALQAQKMEALGRLASAVAHDFNNVLTVIGGHAELLIQQAADPSTAMGAEHIREASLRAGALARQLLNFGRGTGVDAVVLDPNAVLLSVQPLLARMLGTSSRLSLELEPDLLCIRSVASAVEQIALNMAANAREAMPEGGDFTVSTSNVTLATGERPGLDAGDYVCIAFADNGTGIPADTAERVFEPFFTTRAEEGGTGLGLSTVYSAVRQAGGDVELDTEPGRGSTFRLYFPGTGEPAEAARPDAAPSVCLRGTETILIAEDDPGVRAVMTAVLQRYGYNVMTAVDGRQGLDLFQTFGHLIHLVVTDISMPDMTGPEFISAIRDSGSQQPVLYISGFTAESLPVPDGLPRQFLAKPFTPVELAHAVREVLQLGVRAGDGIAR